MQVPDEPCPECHMIASEVWLNCRRNQCPYQGVDVPAHSGHSRRKIKKIHTRKIRVKGEWVDVVDRIEREGE